MLVYHGSKYSERKQAHGKKDREKRLVEIEGALTYFELVQHWCTPGFGEPNQELVGSRL